MMMGKENSVNSIHAWSHIKELLPDWKNYKENTSIGKFCFKIDGLFWSKENIKHSGIHVFVSNLQGDLRWFFVRMPNWKTKNNLRGLHDFVKNNLGQGDSVEIETILLPSKSVRINNIFKVENEQN